MCTRLDICWSVARLSQLLSKPLQEHWTAAMHVLRYLKGTLDYELCYRKCDEGYRDADWSSSSDDRCSTSGYCFSLNRADPLISCKSRTQLTVAVSSCEAEYIAMAAAVQVGLYLAKSVNDVGKMCEPAIIFKGNQCAVALSKYPVSRQRSKHIDVRYQFIRTVQRTCKVFINCYPTTDMVAGVMTKAATKLKPRQFKSYIFGFK